MTVEEAKQRINKRARLHPSGAEVRILDVKKDEAQVSFHGQGKVTWFPLSKLKASSVLDAEDGLVRPPVVLQVKENPKPAKRRKQLLGGLDPAPSSAIAEPVKFRPPEPPPAEPPAAPPPAETPAADDIQTLVLELQECLEALQQSQKNVEAAQALLAETKAQAELQIRTASQELDATQEMFAAVRSRTLAARAKLDQLIEGA